MNGRDLAETLVYNPFRIAAYLSELNRQQEQEKLHQELGSPTGAGHGYIQLRTSCGKLRHVRELCSDPLCEKCEPVRAFRRRRRWYKVLKSMRYPRMITLTIPDGRDLKERFSFLQSSFRRFLHMPLGGRNRAKLHQAALEFAGQHYDNQVASSKMTSLEKSAKLAELEKSLNRFFATIKKRQEKAGKWPRLRHAVGRGFAALEITLNGDWHVHRHLCVDGQYIPWALLCGAWQIATQGQAWITDIRKIDQTPDGMKEAVKYLTKPWEIPLDYQDEFAEAVKGVKRVWPLGGAKPEEEHQVCPYCSNPDCKAQAAGLANLIETGSLWGYTYRIFESDFLTDRKRTRYLEIKRPDGVWDQVTLLDTLSVCAPVGARAGPLARAEIPC